MDRLPGVAAFLVGNDKLKRAYGAADHVIIRLVCGYALHLLARPRENGGQKIIMPSHPAIDLVADTDDDRKHEELEPHSCKRAGNVDKGSGNYAYDDDDEHEACSATGMQSRLWTDVFNRERKTLFVAEYCFVLSTVVCKQPLHILHL